MFVQEDTGLQSILTYFNKSAGFTDKQRSIFFKQLAVILNSGIPLLDGLELLQGRSDSRTGFICHRLQQRLCAGSSLSKAMSMEREFFPDLAVILTGAGELSGELHNVLEDVAVYYARQEEWKRFMYKSAAYPAFLLLTSMAVLLFFILYVLPVLGEAYISMNARPNDFLQLALQINWFLREYFIWLAAAGAITVWGTWQYKRYLFDMTVALPGVAAVYGLLTEIRFCKLLALLLNSGMNITAAVPEAGKIFTDSKRSLQLYLFNRQLQKGVDVGSAAKKTRFIFSALTAEFISIGAATGCLPHMLEEAVIILEQDLQDKLIKCREFLSPALLLAAAMLTAVIVCAVIGPLFEIVSTLPGYD